MAKYETLIRCEFLIKESRLKNRGVQLSKIRMMIER